MASKKSSGFLYLMMFFAIIVSMVYIIHLIGPQFMLNAAAKSQQINNSQSTERFGDNLLSPENIVVYQGNMLPAVPATKMEFDSHESLPNVDGSKDSPKSMFMMSFNKCDASCCPSTYSCSGGCVCMTDKQKDFIGKRGNNSASRCKLKDNPEY